MIFFILYQLFLNNSKSGLEAGGEHQPVKSGPDREGEAEFMGEIRIFNENSLEKEEEQLLGTPYSEERRA